jgi:predicted AAA+ superfamily ATPase
MYRTAMENLYQWKSDPHRKPLIIRGARQVGKIWLMKAFGAEAYPHNVYINFDNNQRMRELFSSDLNV